MTEAFAGNQASTLSNRRRSLRLVDTCPDLRALTFPRRRLHYTVDPLMCGVFVSAFLKHTLLAMPRLRAVHIRLQGIEEHGLGWDVIESIMSTPQLREFTINTFLFSPREVLARDTPLDHLTRLTTFEYARFTKQSLLFVEAQRESLSTVISKLHRSVERLRLPGNFAPMSTLMSLP